MVALNILLKEETPLSLKQIENIIQLIEEGATIPFIARYRKEKTGGVSDEVLRMFEEKYVYFKKFLLRRDEVISALEKQHVWTQRIETFVKQARTLTQLEDIYRPYVQSRKTRASVAIDAGLTPLANALQKADMGKGEFEVLAKRYISKELNSVKEVIKGAQDIIAQRYSDDVKERDILRSSMQKFAILEVKKAKAYKEDGLYKNYQTHSEKIAYIPSHRYLAIMRGVGEKELSVKMSMDMERLVSNIARYKIKKEAKGVKILLLEAYKDGLKRLLYPSLEKEMHKWLKEKSDNAAIELFGQNLSQLLMSAPVLNHVLLGVDPAYKSGCKLAVIDKDGNYIAHDVIYPTAPRNEYERSKKVVLALVKKYNISGVAIGNATASRETQDFFARLNKEENTELPFTVVSEAGASVYSASHIAQEEYPHLDVTIRGAISIAQRLRDPMAALVKIDPKSLGIGQYQHDVEQKKLEKKLYERTEDLVNKIGVDLNSASASLLTYVAGIGERLAKNIVKHREEHGRFETKKELLKVKGLGAKVYEQCAGFVRIKKGKSVYDNTAIHPESYTVAKRIENGDVLEEIFAQTGVGMLTLKDIQNELRKPGYDMREELPPVVFQDKIRELKDIKEGTFVSGIVRNIADFGVFVDIGLKNDGMIHISKLSEKHIKHPLEVVTLNQHLASIKVIMIDAKSEKVGLSLVE